MSKALTGTVLLGRSHELELLEALLEGAAVDGEALLLWGEPGAGKTALLDAAADAASRSGARVLRAAGAEFEADVPFSGLHQVLARALGELERLSDAHRLALLVALGFSDGQPADRLIVSAAALELLRLVAAAEPLMLIVDDLQWLDRSSAVVLAFVARRVSGSRIGFVAASRNGTETFFDHAGIPLCDVERLDDAASADLVSARYPTLAPQVRRRVLAEAKGNPLALLELPTAMSDPQRSAAEVLPSVLPLDRRLHRLFASRLSNLPTRTLQALLLLALEGNADVRVLSATPEHFDLPDLAPAERAGLVSIDSGARRLEFRHPLIAAAVVELATSGERREVHRALADALSEQAERRAWHLAEATVEPDEEVASLLEQAARRILRRGDAVGAVTALLRAADLSPQGGDRARRLAEAAYVGADVTGDLRNVYQRLVDARRADPDDGGSLQAAVAAAQVLLQIDGDVDTTHRLLIGALETQAGTYDASDNALIEALYTLFTVCYFGGRPELWEPFHAALARLKPRPPAILSLSASLFGDPARATPVELDELDAIISRLHAETDPVAIVRVGRASFFVDRTSGCRSAYWRMVRDGREGGAVASAIHALVNLCLDDYLIGEWDEAEQLTDEGLQLCDDHGYDLRAWPFHFARALVAAGRGDHATTWALTDQMLQWAVPRGFLLVRGQVGHARALAAIGMGDFERAYECATAVSPPGTLASHIPFALWSVMDLVEAAVRTGRHAEATAHVAAMRKAGLAALSPRLALLSGGSAAIAADEDSATDLFEQALANLGVARWPFDLARVRLAYGEHLRRIRAIADARAQLAAALEGFEQLGARPWAARARRELQASGQVNGEPGRSRLTPQELEIARLVAGGLTNKEIGQRLYLSHRTVAAHLYRMFPKLGIKSRSAVADALRSTP